MANLITLEEYKVSKGIESLKEDAKLTALVVSVSQLVKTYCGNSFVDYYAADKTETFNVEYEAHTIQLTESPVNSITSVEERLTYADAYVALTVGAQEYYFEPNTDSIYRTTGAGWKNWPIGPGSVKVLYKAGYATIPADLKLAIIDLITYYHKEEYKERRTIGSASITNITTSSQWRNVSFPDHIKRILDLYKQIQV